MTRCASMDVRVPGFAPGRCGVSASATARDALNGTSARRPKPMTTEVEGGAGSHARSRWPWGSIAVALVAIASVVAGELWAFREAPALATDARSEVVTDVDSTLASVVAASVLIAPAD